MGFETLFYCKIVKAPLKVRRRVKGGKLQESSAQVATSQSCCVWIYFGLPLTARVGLFCRLDFAIDPPLPLRLEHKYKSVLKKLDFSQL